MGFSQIAQFILAKAIFIIPFYPSAKANGNEGKQKRFHFRMDVPNSLVSVDFIA
jgi:hypothetical protein